MNTLKPINPYLFNQPSGVNNTASHEGKSANSGVVKRQDNQNPTDKKTDNKETPVENDKEKIENTEISKYIGLIVKLENGLDNGAFSNKDIQKITKLFQDKLDSLPMKITKKIESSFTYEKMELDPQDSFANQTADMIINGDEDERMTVFNFLKSKEFISALKDEPLTTLTFDSKGIKSSDKSV